MLRSFAIGLGGYAASAVVYLVFSVVFVRQYGTEAYAGFSLLLNTVSALTMFGNYHGALVSHSAATERQAFFAMLRSVLIYAVIFAMVSGAALALIGDLHPGWIAPAALAFAFAIAAGLPTAVLLASPANWLVNVARAVYQTLLILGFWAMFALGVGLGAAFVISLVVSAAVYLSLIAKKVEFTLPPPAATPAPSGILWLALVWNIAHMGVMLTDKFAIRFLDVGTNFADAGLFLLYLDISGRFSAVFIIGLPPLTYELLRRLREGISIVPTAATALAICAVVGGVVALVGYHVIPRLYGTDLSGREALPLVMGVYIALLGLGTLLLAYCNSSGQPRILVWHYTGVFAVGVAALAGFYVAGGYHIGIVALAVALAVGQAFVLVSAVILLVRVHRRRRAVLRTPRTPREPTAGVVQPPVTATAPGTLGDP